MAALVVLATAGSTWLVDRSAVGRAPRNGVTIAVLPFTSLGHGTEPYLADALAEELVTAMSRFRDVTVLAGDSGFRHRGDVGGGKVRHEPGADYVLSGSVGRDESRVRVAVRLVDARTGETRWAERYERPRPTLFELQDDVADPAVANAVGHARHSAAERVRGRPARTLEAHELVLRARQGFNAFDRDGALEAHALLRGALEIDPKHAAAWELLARLLLRFHMVPFDESRYRSPGVLDEARRAAVRALSLDERLSSAHDALGYVLLLQHRYEASLASLRRAIELNPNEAGAFRSYGDALGRLGEHRASIEALERARRLDPFSPPIVPALMGRAYGMLGEHGKALELARECSERTPAFRICLAVQAVAASALGRAEEARVARDRLLDAHPTVTVRSLARGFRSEADEARWAGLLRAAGIPD